MRGVTHPSNKSYLVCFVSETVRPQTLDEHHHEMRRKPSSRRALAISRARLVVLLAVLGIVIAIIVKLCLTHDKVTSIEERLSNATFTSSTLCNDHNSCTLDGFDEDGRCVHSVLPQGYPCVSLCGSTATCDNGKCVPGVCDGSCDTPADCPAFLLYPNTTEEVQIPAYCLASMCVYETLANQTEFSILPSAQNLLLDQICGMSAMGLTGHRHNSTQMVPTDFDQDGIVDDKDLLTSFDPMNQSPPQIVIGTLFPGPDILVLTNPAYLNGWSRTLQEGPMASLSTPIVSVQSGELAFGTSFGTPVGNLIGTCVWDAPSPVDMSELRYFGGLVEGTALGQTILISLEDSGSNTVSVTVVPPTGFVAEPWVVDLDFAGFDRSAVVKITIASTQLIVNSDVVISNLHFTPETPIGSVAIEQCMNHTPKNMQGDTAINCLHWFKCASASTILGLP